MLKTKKSKFIVLTILTIAILLFLSPLIGSIEHFFGLKGVENQIFDGDVDVSVSVNVELGPGSSPYGYMYSVKIHLIYSSSVTTVGIERINYRIYHNAVVVYTYNGIYLPTGMNLRSIVLQVGDSLTCQGSVDFNYQLNSIPQNATVNYNVVYTHNIRGQDAQGIILFRMAISIAYLASFFLLPIILYFIIHPDFHELSKEEKERNKAYFDFFAKRIQKEREESSTKN